MNLECDPSLANYSSTTWTGKTDQMFSFFCKLVGKQTAAKDWKLYAEANGFTGDVTGMYDFIALNMQKLVLPAGSDSTKNELVKAVKDLKPPSAEKMVAPTFKDTIKGSGFGASAAELPPELMRAPFGRG